MYGDMSRVRADAAQLRSMAEEMRARSVSLTSQAQSMGWKSGAAEMFRQQITKVAEDLGRTAASLDASAAALTAHASAVDKVKAAIAEAQRWVGQRLDEATTIASNAVNVVREVGEGAVNGFMKVLSTVVNGAKVVCTVSVHMLFGNEVPEAVVRQAEVVVRSVGTRPVHGSKEWLQLKDRFVGNGW